MTEDSFSASSSAPSINKIPFLVFDAILVIAAVVLALTAGGPLSPLLFFWILLCVLVGGVVACLPFWIEFRDKVRLSEYEIRERQNSAQDSQWQYVDARLTEQNEFLQKLHLRLADSAERLASLEARPPTPTADEVATLCSSSLQKQWPQWQETLLGVLSKRTDILFNEQNAQNAKLSAAQETRIADLRKEFANVEAVLRSLDERIAEIALLAAASAANALNTRGNEHGSSDTEKNAQLTSGHTADEQPADEQPADGAATDQQHADSIQALLVSEKEDETAEAALYEDEEAGFLNAEDFADEDLDDEDLADGESDDGEFTDEEFVDEDEDHDDLADEDLDDGEFGDELDDETQAGADELPAAPIETFAEAGAAATESNAFEDEAVSEPANAASPTTAEPATIPQQPALLETPEQPARPKTSTTNDKTTLVAQVLIGIGNKPYVRGTGPGLSMDKGVPMQFVEIGKWEWVCPSGTEPIKILIYKNDEVPSSLGEIELEAGQRRAVTPTFAR